MGKEVSLQSKRLLRVSGRSLRLSQILYLAEQMTSSCAPCRVYSFDADTTDPGGAFPDSLAVKFFFVTRPPQSEGRTDEVDVLEELGRCKSGLRMGQEGVLTADAVLLTARLAGPPIQITAASPNWHLAAVIMERADGSLSDMKGRLSYLDAVRCDDF